MVIKRSILNSNDGQTTVEYILLFAVVIAIVTAVFTNPRFKNLFGKQGTFATGYKSEIEYTYRHALFKREAYTTPDYSSPDHDSYKGRFFSAKDKYPAR